MRLSKKVIKRDNWLLLWNKTQKWQLNVLFIFLEMRLSKKVIKSDSSIIAFTVKQTQNDILFISLNCDCQKSLRWSLKVKQKWQLKVPSISLVCDFFCHVRPQLELNRLTETHQILVEGFFILPNYLLLLMGIVCLFCFKLR